jgi:hypothetical protein
MQTRTASIHITDVEAALVEQTAAFYRMDVQAFLAAALTYGIGCAESIMDSAESARQPRQRKRPDNAPGQHAA